MYSWWKRLTNTNPTVSQLFKQTRAASSIGVAQISTFSAGGKADKYKPYSQSVSQSVVQTNEGRILGRGLSRRKTSFAF